MNITENLNCKPGTLLRVRRRFVTQYAHSYKPGGEKFYFADVGDDIRTVLGKGDFTIWLQVDDSMQEYCFCLHAQTSRVLALNVWDLEVVNLEGEVK